MTSDVLSFVPLDYVVFTFTLLFSAAIGVYFGCFGSKQKTATEYLFGSGHKRVIPIGLSIYSSAVSSIAIVGTPQEIYVFGIQFMAVYIGMVLSLVIVWFFVLPVFCGPLNLTTPYEYFEKRFDYKVRVTLTIIYFLQALLLLPAILYSATVAFSESSGISITVCTTVVGGICIFYTMLVILTCQHLCGPITRAHFQGGFSAVVWSDSLQATLMFFSCVFVLVKAVVNIGSFQEIWDRAQNGGRINFFTMDPNPFRRLTFWSASVGFMFVFAAHSGCGASGIQRYMALRNEKQARIGTFIGTTIAAVFGVVTSLIGLAMYAQYYNCDPVKNKEISGYNKLVPYFVAYTFKNIPGYLGFFNAGVLSAGLSTISAELNTISGLIHNCFIKKYFKKYSGEKEGAIIMKLLVIVNGLIFVALAPLLDKSKYIFSLVLGIFGITYGAKVGMMILGTTFPRVNSIGVISGTITGMVIVAWLQIGSMFYDVSSADVLPLTTDGCDMNDTFTKYTNSTSIPVVYKEESPFIYKLSYMYFTLTGILTNMIVSIIVSYITGPNNVEDMDPNLFISWARPKKINSAETVHMLHSKDKNPVLK